MMGQNDKKLPVRFSGSYIPKEGEEEGEGGRGGGGV